MTNLKRWAPIVALALIFTCGTAHAQGVYNKSAFESAMDDAMKSMRVLLGTLIGEDWAKAQTEAASLAATAKKVRALTPKSGADKIGEFQAHADSLEARTNRFAAAAKARDAGKATAVYGQAVSACIDCHKVFRK
jgi:cytochrome c556